MKKSILFLAISLAPVFVQAEAIKSIAANNPEKVRLIVTGEPNLVSTQGVAQSLSFKKAFEGVSSVEVNASDADAMIELLKQQPGVKAVEKDIRTSVQPVSKALMTEVVSETISSAAASSTPNDPEYPNQYSWFSPGEFFPGQHDIITGFQESSPMRKLRIGMTDSGFYDREDIQYAGGYNFATLNGGTVSPLFYEDEYNPSCTTPHGGAVAHIIGAKTNNSVGVAGIVDADLFATRVMDCGSGLLSEMATGIRWLAGDTSISGVTPIDKPVDIINISMGGVVSEPGNCPTYVQDAVNYAYNKGIAVFAAAGNDGINANLQTPANCDNVITVASIDRYGNQSDFTNYGEVIDVAAVGELVRSEGTTGYSYWYGTSFATPNVVGMAALAKQAFPVMTVDELYNFVKTTTRAFPAGGTQNALGTGVMDAKNLVRTVNELVVSSSSLVKPALDSSERCQDTALLSIPYLDDQGGSVDACAVFEVDVSLLQKPSGFPNTALYRVPEDQGYSLASAELVKASDQNKFVVYSLNPEMYDYGVAFCDATNTNCASADLIPANDDLIDPLRYCTN